MSIDRIPHHDSLIFKEEPRIRLLSQSTLLTPEQCDEILKIDSSKFPPGVVTYDGVTHVVNDNWRIVKAGWVHREGYEWLYTAVRVKAAELNETHFGVNIIGILDDISFMRYEADESGGERHGKFSWHSDIGSGYTNMRKLSMIVGLSDPSEYEGGELKLFINGELNVGKLKKGEVVVFPSFVQHCVTPVTKGVRQTLVVFVSGPRYR
jgi:predicted 2-oxoglutarate/Fe(II)-dependent dioxygenase YbiX